MRHHSRRSRLAWLFVLAACDAGPVAPAASRHPFLFGREAVDGDGVTEILDADPYGR